jgi:hypothetical protein
MMPRTMLSVRQCTPAFPPPPPHTQQLQCTPLPATTTPHTHTCRPLDGTQGPSRSRGALETYGLLNTTWDGFSHPRLLATLRSLG